MVFETPFGVLRDGEWGYQVIAISNSKQVIAEFPVEEHGT
jgi:hypothetical protein